jgi:hypothetical protein
VEINSAITAGLTVAENPKCCGAESTDWEAMIQDN